MLSLTRPDVVLEAHSELLNAGAHAVATNTFGANRTVMQQYETADQASRVNYESARIARGASDRFATGRRFRPTVIGSIGPTLSGHLKVEETTELFAQLEAAYLEQVQALLLGGVDALHLEGCQNLIIARAALSAIRKLLAGAEKDIPVVITASIEATGSLLDGNTYAGFADAVSAFQPLACGIVGPLPVVSKMCTALAHNLPTIVLVNAFSLGVGYEKPNETAVALSTCAQHRTAIVGLGRGGGPDHVRELARALAPSGDTVA